MSCHGCCESFGFLNRERGCPKCGFSYCKRCLRFKIPEDVHAKSEKTVLVCKKCFDIASTPNRMMDRKTSVEDTEAVEAKLDPLTFREAAQVLKAMHRLESLENPSKPPIIVYKKPKLDSEMENLKCGLAPQDQQLVDRLANLRNAEKSLLKRQTSDPVEEISTRLAHLRGEDHPVLGVKSKSDALPQQKKETEDDLLDRLAREQELDKKYNENAVADLEARLERLRSPSKSPRPPVEGEEGEHKPPLQRQDELAEPPTEEEQIQKIIDQFTAEATLDSVLPDGFTADDGTESTTADRSLDESDDDTMCRVCDGKAVLQCKECDDDEFCANCFKEFHVEIGEAHRPTRIRK